MVKVWIRAAVEECSECYPRLFNGKGYPRYFKMFDKPTHTIFQTHKDVNVENVGSSLSQRLSNLVFYNVYLGVYWRQ